MKKKQNQKEMKGQQQFKKSKVVKIDSLKSWERYITNATNQGCPVSLICFMGISFNINKFAYIVVTIVSQGI